MRYKIKFAYNLHTNLIKLSKIVAKKRNKMKNKTHMYLIINYMIIHEKLWKTTAPDS